MKRYHDTEMPSRNSLEKHPTGDFVKYEEVCLEIDEWRRTVVRQRAELEQLKTVIEKLQTRVVELEELAEGRVDLILNRLQREAAEAEGGNDE